MIDVIQKRNGFFVKLITYRKVLDKTFYRIHDEHGFKELDENQVVGEPMTIDETYLNTMQMHTVVKRNIKAELKALKGQKNTECDILKMLQFNNIKHIDNRHKGGCLWIHYSNHLEALIKSFKHLGFNFIFCNSSKALGRNQGWFLMNN